MHTRNTAVQVCGILRYGKTRYRTRTRVTRFGNTSGLPVPLLKPKCPWDKRWWSWLFFYLPWMREVSCWSWVVIGWGMCRVWLDLFHQRGQGLRLLNKSHPLDFWMFLANTVIASARLLRILRAELSGFLIGSSGPSSLGSSGSSRSPFPAPSSPKSSSLGILFKEPWGSSLTVLLVLWEECVFQMQCLEFFWHFWSFWCCDQSCWG